MTGECQSEDAIERLAALIETRKASASEKSWTAALLAMGPEKCAEKFGEEMIEAIVEAVKGDRDGLIYEAADVIYHFLVMLSSRQVTLSDVLTDLEARYCEY